METELIILRKADVERLLRKSKETHSMTPWEVGYCSGREATLEWLLDKTVLDTAYLK
jgi:hypothetical protein